MSASAGSSTPAASAPRRQLRLPRWIAPRPQDPTGDGASYVVRTLETALAILIAIVLAVAVAHDVKRQVDISLRTAADGRTWTKFAEAHLQPLARQQHERLGIRIPETGTTDYPCQPTALTRKYKRDQSRLCLMVSGPLVHGRRTIDGGYYLLPGREDRSVSRYGCFGEPARLAMCGLQHTPKGFPKPTV